jgi:tRNA(Ile)-lysidine synthase
MGPHPAVAEVRGCVRRSLTEFTAGDLVLAACSGGADSLALAAALAHEAPRCALRAGGITVDHGLQPGSAERSLVVAGLLADLGLDPVEVVAVSVPGGPGHGGPEAAARDARYAGIEEAAGRAGAVAVLLGHSRDDQAETVLLGLARGSGPRSLAGMPGAHGRYRRPLLGLSRATMRAACQALGLRPWDDPQNADPAFARARVRHQALPALEAALGPGVAEALARTARQLRADTDFLDELAETQAARIGDSGHGWRADLLADLPGAIRTRVLRLAAIAAGCPAGALSARHLAALDALVSAWHGQRWVDLPGGVRVTRHCGKLLFTKGQRTGPGGETEIDPASATEPEEPVGRTRRESGPQGDPDTG